MSAFDRLEDFNLPALIRRATDQHLARIERAEGFVEGVDAAGALTPATVETLSITLDDAVSARRQVLEG